ncbi:hypothetical protein LTR06_008903 [Exophiala xenobiotica]|nr:hypothetical protein LTR06_008903 [Exophiala xenobiotica]
MQARDTSSLIYTPYLVNMILVDVCLPDTLAEDGSELNLELRQRSYNAAKRGLDEEEGNVSLAYVAALGVQWTYLNTNGQDQLGNAIFHQQIFLVKGLDKWRSKLERNQTLTAENLYAVDVSLGRLEWTIYCLNLFIGLALEQVYLSDKPTREKAVGNLPSGETCDEHADWMPYPVPHSPIDWHPNCHYLAYISLSEMVNADEALYKEKRRAEPEKMAQKFEDLFRKVKAWPETIKPCMRMYDRAMPYVIALHELLELMRHTWGADHFPVIMIQPATIAAFALVEDVERSPRSGEAFYKICLILRAASRRFRVNKGVLRLLDHTVKDRHIALPNGCQELLADFNTGMELDDVATTRTDDPGLDYLLEKWDDLDLDDTVSR